MNRNLVRAFIIGTFVVWIAFDVWLTQNGGPTESQVLAEWSMSSTWLPHMVGFICGHWFVPVKRPWRSGWMWALPLWALLIVWDALWNRGMLEWSTPARYSGIWLILGVVSGALLWPQQSDKSPL